MTVEADFARIAHDMRGALGSLRMVCGLLHEDPALGDHRALLTSAEIEIQRLAAGLTALPPLAAAAAGPEEMTEVELLGEIRRAAATSAHHGAPARIGDIAPIEVHARAAALRLGLPALLVLAAAETGGTEITAAVDSDGVTLCCAGKLWPQGRHLARLLAASIGWALEDDSDGMRLRMVRA